MWWPFRRKPRKSRPPKQITRRGVAYHHVGNTTYRADDGNILPHWLVILLLSDDGSVAASKYDCSIGTERSSYSPDAATGSWGSHDSLGHSSRDSLSDYDSHSSHDHGHSGGYDGGGYSGGDSGGGGDGGGGD